jgi:hypothetical protein
MSIDSAPLMADPDASHDIREFPFAPPPAVRPQKRASE